MERDELAAWLRLALTPGVGPASARKLLAAFGLPGDVLRQSAQALEQVVSAAQADALRDVPPRLGALLDETERWLQGSEDGVSRRILTLADPGYPSSLLEIDDPPLMLYLLGAPGFELAHLGTAIAIVGSRNPTPQGELNARSFAHALSDAGWTVISGLALGIDGAAHQGALDATIDRQAPVTVAVVATGLDRVYPARHRALAHAIARRGLIVSEFPLGTPPLNANFPKRNRILAGLAQGTLVVEAALKSGSLITARLAAEQGKEVFAIPGSIHSPQSRGCHALIRQGAKLVESVSDVLEELLPSSAMNSIAEVANQSDPADRFDVQGHAPDADRDDGARQDPLLDALGYDPVSLDALGARTGWGAAQLQAKLLELELAGEVARLPGGLFQRVTSA